MNVKTTYYRGAFVLFVYLIFSVFVDNIYGANTLGSDLSEEELESKVLNLSNNIDFRFTKDVKEYIDIYTQNGKVSTSNILSTIPIYFPIFEEIIKAKNLPEELKVLAIVESHLKVNAKSSAGAAGLWQMIKGTAKSYNLRVGSSIDERYSVEQSTEAAMDFLQDLYSEFGDWTLALAAYNCGPGGVRRAIKKSGGKTDFWEIKKYLPRETRRYVPKFIAISYILEHYKDYDLEIYIPQKEYFQTAEAKVFKHLSFRKIAKITGLDIKIIKNLNNEYRKNYIPTSSRGHKLILPKDAIYKLIHSEGSEFISFEKEKEYDYLKYFENNFSRETIVDILGYKYALKKMSISKIHFRIFLINNKIQSKLEQLPIRSPFGTDAYKNTSFVKHHILKPGETLDEIAAIYNMRMIDLLTINNISLSKPPVVGSVIGIKI